MSTPLRNPTSNGAPTPEAVPREGLERINASAIPRTRHGSRSPGWDEPADLEKDPAGIPDPALLDVPRVLRREIEELMARYPERHSAAIPALAAAQRHHGWCSPQAILQAACVMRVTPAYLTSVATFYDMFELEPAGRHRVYVCTNISCSLRGADELYAALEEAAEDDGDINLRHFECLGACDIAPMVSVDNVYYGPLETADAKRLVEDLSAGREPLPELALALRANADAELPKARRQAKAAAAKAAAAKGSSSAKTTRKSKPSSARSATAAAPRRRRAT